MVTFADDTFFMFRRDAIKNSLNTSSHGTSIFATAILADGFINIPLILTCYFYRLSSIISLTNKYYIKIPNFNM